MGEEPVDTIGQLANLLEKENRAREVGLQRCAEEPGQNLEVAADQRPLLRRAATRTINGMLRLALGFRGTDTHGLKAFHREALSPVAARCVVDKDLFASEFVIRAERDGLRVVEIPVTVHEKRPPSIQLTSRVPRVLRDLARLVVVIRLRGD